MVEDGYDDYNTMMEWVLIMSVHKKWLSCKT
jgi:hypothetical protein